MKPGLHSDLRPLPPSGPPMRRRTVAESTMMLQPENHSFLDPWRILFCPLVSLQVLLLLRPPPTAGRSIVDPLLTSFFFKTTSCCPTCEAARNRFLRIVLSLLQIQSLLTDGPRSLASLRLTSRGSPRYHLAR